MESVSLSQHTQNIRSLSLNIRRYLIEGRLTVTSLIQKSTVSEIEMVETDRTGPLTHLGHPVTATYGGIHQVQWMMWN